MLVLRVLMRDHGAEDFHWLDFHPLPGETADELLVRISLLDRVKYDLLSIQLMALL